LNIFVEFFLNFLYVLDVAPVGLRKGNIFKNDPLYFLELIIKLVNLNLSFYLIYLIYFLILICAPKTPKKESEPVQLITRLVPKANSKHLETVDGK